MADLLSHVLIVYALLTVVSWKVERVTSKWIAVAMGGAAIPDLTKAHILLKSFVIEETVGIPFDYSAVSTVGGVVLVAAVLTVAFDRDHWRRVYGYLLLGGTTSLVVDGLRVFADGRSTPWLFPLTWWEPPTPSLYVSSDVRVAAITILTALAVFLLDSYLWSGDKNRRAEPEGETR